MKKALKIINLLVACAIVYISMKLLWNIGIGLDEQQALEEFLTIQFHTGYVWLLMLLAFFNVCEAAFQMYKKK